MEISMAVHTASTRSEGELRSRSSRDRRQRASG
jgi:hypothetical protein